MSVGVGFVAGALAAQELELELELGFDFKVDEHFKLVSWWSGRWFGWRGGLQTFFTLEARVVIVRDLANVPASGWSLLPPSAVSVEMGEEARDEVRDDPRESWCRVFMPIRSVDAASMSER